MRYLLKGYSTDHYGQDEIRQVVREDKVDFWITLFLSKPNRKVIVKQKKPSGPSTGWRKLKILESDNQGNILVKYP